MDYAAAILAKIPGTSSKLDKGLKPLVATLDAYMPAEQVGQIMSAYEFSSIAHSGQTRLSGEPYISHPLAVAQILADMHMDSQAIAAAILHEEHAPHDDAAYASLFPGGEDLFVVRHEALEWIEGENPAFHIRVTRLSSAPCGS